MPSNRPDPQPWTHADRLALAEEISNRLREIHGETLLAVGLYGSTARGTDGPYSDIEMWCVLTALPSEGERDRQNVSERGDHYSHEWVHGPWKAEVDVYAADALLEKATHIDSEWPLKHGRFESVLPVYDPHAFFARLRAAADSAPPEHFRDAVRELVVGEIYEDVAKVRNAIAAGNHAALPQLALALATYGAYAIGLANRHRFSTGVRAFEEALTLPNRPLAYDRLARLALDGTLSDPTAISDAIERFWLDLVPWVERHGITISEPRRIPF